jgi:hypothetical protein
VPDEREAAAAQAAAADLKSPEIIDNEVNVGWRREPAVQVRIDHPAACLDGILVAEIVGGFENEPGRLHRGRLTGSSARSAEALA